MGHSGPASFTYDITDGQGGTDTGKVTLSVGSNAAPEGMDDAYSVDEDAVLSVAAAGVLANDTDADGDSLSAAVLSDVSNGTLVLNGDGSFEYTPDADYNGEDSFTYTVADGKGGEDTATVTIDVKAVNDAPVLADLDPIDILENSTTVATVGATDIDSDDLIYSLVGGDDADFFSIDASTGALSFKAAPDFEDPSDLDQDNTYEVQIQVSDGDLTDDQFVFVTVLDEAELPILNEVVGTKGSDFVVGTEGDDLINSLDGQLDVLTGLAGADTFDFSTSSSNGQREVRRITDFNADEDSLLLGEGIEALAVREARGNTYIALSEDRDVIILEGVSGFDTDSFL
ncbi:Ig-like domain-containing protein [Roseobacter sp.]|uniref:Ig-like domain-containing protein n=1 Tax=Roseobacter sp. TaxID=1907202 RepID=UPI002966495A|nr:tandem-95 repeat protein [Roseobacter sp.]MDW3181516.1 tandem-95 repeat protein [Roseobacter sp.]